MEWITGDSILCILEHLQANKKTGCVHIAVFLVSRAWCRMARRCLVRNTRYVAEYNLCMIRNSLVGGGSFNVSGAFKTKDSAAELCLLLEHIVVYRLMVVVRSDMLVQLADCLLKRGVGVLDITVEDGLSQAAANSLVPLLRESRVRVGSAMPHLNDLGWETEYNALRIRFLYKHSGY